MKAKRLANIAATLVVFVWLVRQAVRGFQYTNLWSLTAGVRYSLIAMLVVAVTCVVYALDQLQAGKDPQALSKVVRYGCGVSLICVYAWCAALLLPFVVNAPMLWQHVHMIIAAVARVAVTVFVITLATRLCRFINTYIYEKYFVA